MKPLEVKVMINAYSNSPPRDAGRFFQAIQSSGAGIPHELLSLSPTVEVGRDCLRVAFDVRIAPDQVARLETALRSRLSNTGFGRVQVVVLAALSSG